jgi:glucoamylase
MKTSPSHAPGWPGIPPRWTSSAKIGVGTAITPISKVWFTLSHGILNEVYYPRVDTACVRDLGLIVTDDHGFFSEEKRHARSEVALLVAGAPAFRLTNRCTHGRYEIQKEVLADPRRDVVLQRTRLVTAKGFERARLHVLLAPHIGNHGAGNTAWVGDYKGYPMFFAMRDGTALALACSVPWLARSVGFAGASDGWTSLAHHGRLTESYQRAENGNVAIAGEVDTSSGASFVLALGFGSAADEAGHRALASLHQGFDAAQEAYVRGWSEWQAKLLDLDPEPRRPGSLYRVSASVLRTHEAKGFPGGVIASLSIPWGTIKGDADLGGYHLVWPRDLVETAGGLLAVGAHEDARRVLAYLRTTQEADGHWPQNTWLDGHAYWHEVQMDETALPILLVDLARREGALDERGVADLWPMVSRAAGYLVRNGPVTAQDRWEENAGYSPFTLATEIAALLVAAELAELAGDVAAATYLRETADTWNDGIERWTYVTGTDLARSVGVEGYYVRIAPPDVAEGASRGHGFVPIKNRSPGQGAEPADELIATDAFALVRFGLRAADDPRIVSTMKVIDALLLATTPNGPAWRRYNGDGYGEHDDGSPFDGAGVGRAWPLLTGERAHYELAAGRPAEAERLLGALERFASDGGLLPEQVWDGPDLPERELFHGKATGSARPLVWAHAEYLKLVRSLRDGRVFDAPPQTALRYVAARTESRFVSWRFNHECHTLRAGKALRIEGLAPMRVRFSTDEWRTQGDVDAVPVGLGMHVADLPTGDLAPGSVIHFTLYWLDAQRWEGVDFAVKVVPRG